ncbi:sushi, von Willebrand factor type A, EGF and pentraxin domain-containing protein 1-like [Sycon ciliatum]|uniref:sushi, von Willebrand factor type A, EGF and pentraxin domain-containing protein 1-like n=1 Tax=Sycon ciliatum TaxID=27933 RepID=UPI0031F69B48
MWRVVLLVVLSATWMSVPASAATCQPTPNLSNGYYTTSISSFTNGGTATAHCFPGYQGNRPNSITCVNGTWPMVASSLPTCTSITCSAAPTIANGYLTFNSGSFMDGGLATVSCFPGYNLTGSATISCRGGQWPSGAFRPTCTQITCTPPLTSPANGKIGSSSNVVGGATYFTCNSGYTLVGKSSSVCTTSGSWSQPAPTCQEIMCSGSVTAPTNGHVTGNGNTLSSVRQFSCMEGYQLSGASYTICLADGTWSTANPVCTQIMCSGSVTAPTNGNVTSAGNTLSLVRQFSCMDGYQLSGTSYTICQANGTWSTASPVCTQITCTPPLTSPANGKIGSSSNVVGGATYFTCNSGFTLVGTSASVCTTSGSWSQPAPTCQEIMCSGSVTAPTNGNVTSAGNTLSSVRQFSCMDGYQLSGTSYTICQANGTWSTASPVCTQITCTPPLTSPANGKIGSSSNVVGGATYFTCNSGFTLVGTSASVCTTSGSWSQPAPTCQEIMCSGSVTAPTNGNVTSAGNTLSSVRQFSCMDGYQLAGTSYTICQANGTWSTASPVCTQITCTPPLTSPANGKIGSSSNVVGGATYLTCNSGFTLVGTSASVCTTSGSWSQPAPTCQEIMCSGSVTAPTNGNVTGNGNTLSSVRQFSCMEGYQLSGTSYTICLANGTWSTANPVCTHFTCTPPLTSPANGKIGSSSNVVGGATYFTCNSGFTLVGTSASVCTTSGSWSQPAPTCQEIMCSGSVTAPTNGNVTSAGNTLSSVRQFSCMDGYQLSGTSYTICQANGTWSTASPVCTQITCTPPLTSPANGKIGSSSNVVGGATYFTCNSGFTLVGTGASVCTTSGSWSQPAPTCQEIMCSGSVTAPTNGNVTSAGNTLSLVRQFSCMDGYQLSGTSYTICQANGTWSTASPVCTQITCTPPLTSPANGKIGSSSNVVGGATYFTCNSGFTLVGTSASVCTTSGSWSQPAPTCQEIMCSGSVTAPTNGNVTSAGNTLSSVRQFSCMDGYQLSGTSYTICQANGTWSTASPVCTQITCTPPLTSPANGKIGSSSNVVGGATSFTCNSGFTLVGTSASVCTTSGSWSQPAPTCQEIMCSGSVTAPTNGNVTSAGNTLSSVRQFSCMEGYQLSGTSYTICQANGTWSTASPVCTLIGCLPLDAPGNGSIVSSSPLRTDFACDQGFAIIGDPSPMCLTTAYNWTSGTPTCAELPECPDLTVDNADVLSGSSKVNSTRVVTCTPGFEMLGDSMVVCLDDGNWSSIPICFQPVEFNPLMVTNGKVSEGQNTVGSIRTVMCNADHKLSGDRTIVCLEDGSWSSSSTCKEPVECNPLMVTNGKVSEGQNTVGSIRTVMCNADHKLSGDRTIVCLEDGSWSSSSTCKATGPPVALIPSTEIQEPTAAASTFLSQGGSVALIVVIAVLFMMLLIAVIAIIRLRRDFPEHHKHESPVSYNNKRENVQIATLTHTPPIPESNLYATLNKPHSATPAVQMEVAYTDLTFTTPPADSPANSQV